MHWHQPSEWVIVTDSVCRITVLDDRGAPQVTDVKTGDLWCGSSPGQREACRSTRRRSMKSV
jgi:hypothetical protein